MPQNNKLLRLERIAEVIHKELAEIIVKNCCDPRLNKITITNVKVSADLSIAKIYFSSFNNDLEQIKQILSLLKKHASSFLRSELANKKLLRKTPELKFFYDENINYANDMDNLFTKIGL